MILSLSAALSIADCILFPGVTFHSAAEEAPINIKNKIKIKLTKNTLLLLLKILSSP